MRLSRRDLILAAALPALGAAARPAVPPKGFVTVQRGKLALDGKPYRFAGANLWYGAWLGAPADFGDVERLRRELDRLKALGVTNLRVLGAGERSPAKAAVSPTFQEEPGVYRQDLLKGLDVLLAEMARRDMKAVVYVNNFWDWSGGMPAYLNWVGSGPWFQQGDPNHPWPEYPDYAARFYGDAKANALFLRYLRGLIGRVNTVTGEPYRDDPTIMAWQLANEPRPGGTAVFGARNMPVFQQWVRDTSKLIKTLDPGHLVCTGSEGLKGCLESEACVLDAHRPDTIDYVTAHVWPNNWGWIDPKNQPATYEAGEARCRDYVTRHIAIARQLGKPLVIEEFGLIREARAFAPGSATADKDRFYRTIYGLALEDMKAGGPTAGTNFWAWNGEGRAQHPDAWFAAGDKSFVGDPPQEEQGLYGVFDTDASTLAVIAEHAAAVKAL
ncbi:mannanase [Caulobacter segnis]|uniref:mannan endo-1,4-beta-mannosidase n=2 Tax=Caulobacter segnis TaxID=88688 RepID=D5VNC4_CAUST|nr:cellulase family glycosylhydrolase [Caulobacter segnis]ADG11997.1 Mannan endo-1,4-beta-mannosidase [Caulobacter segnis ATCC 21756]AVQ03616.1 mannanase [Caulobacter segnis]